MSTRHNERPCSQESAASELARYGRLLDAADSHIIAMSPRLYRLAAVKANHLLREHMGVPGVREACAESDALSEILSGLLFEIELELGLTSVSIDFSKFSLPRH